MAGELVLVIDDSPTITKVVQLVLTKADLPSERALHEAAEAASAEAQRHGAAHPELLATSSETGRGIPELRAVLAALAAPRT